MKAKDLTKIVKRVLQENQDARDSDFRLVCWVYYYINPDVLGMPFSKVMWNHNELNIPPFETVRRTRQKLQHDHPELRGKVYEKRMEKQFEYIDQFVFGGLDDV